MAFSGRAKFPPPYLDITLDRPSTDAPPSSSSSSSSSSPARDKGGVKADREADDDDGRVECRVLLGLTVVQYECGVPFCFLGSTIGIVSDA
jgi:hypothetical protein